MMVRRVYCKNAKMLLFLNQAFDHPLPPFFPYYLIYFKVNSQWIKFVRNLEVPT